MTARPETAETSPPAGRSVPTTLVRASFATVALVVASTQAMTTAVLGTRSGDSDVTIYVVTGGGLVAIAVAVAFVAAREFVRRHEHVAVGATRWTGLVQMEWVGVAGVVVTVAGLAATAFLPVRTWNPIRWMLVATGAVTVVVAAVQVLCFVAEHRRRHGLGVDEATKE